MLSLHQRPGVQRLGRTRALLFSKVGRVALAVLCLAVVLLGFSKYRAASRPGSTSFDTGHLVSGAVAPTQPHVTRSTKARLHLLVPATSSNSDLCKLLLSAQILNYPTPVFINLHDAEDLENAYKQHLSKVEGILKYLNQLETSGEYAEDLVLIVDGFDVWFQLRPDVLIKRYYEINNAANARAREQYGDELVEAHNIRQTIVFGPDKICWPIDWSRPACWAVPETMLPKYAFGPQTSNGRQEMNMPRWLNSGTILGPLQDMIALFTRTLEEITNNHVTDSDQFYFANIFGEQEYSRIARRPELLKQLKKVKYEEELSWPGDNITRSEPKLSQNSNVEYHIGIDYASSAFQTLAFWKQYLGFMRPVDSWKPPQNPRPLHYRRPWNPYALELPEDIRYSAPPFEALKSAGESLPVAGSSWTDVELHYNAITGLIPVLIHFTGEKHFRQIWWQKMWFQSRARELRLASRQPSTDPITPAPINNLTWYNAAPEEAADVVMGGRGGAWSDTGGWFSWNKLCKVHDGALFDVPNEDFYHAPPGKPIAQR